MTSQTTAANQAEISSFEVLTQSILDAEQQMKRLAEDVEQKRTAVLQQICSAMKALNISTDDVTAHLNMSSTIVQVDKQPSQEQSTQGAQGAGNIETPPAEQKPVIERYGSSPATSTEEVGAQSAANIKGASVEKVQPAAGSGAKFTGFPGGNRKAS